jgi:hypothetical protein
METPLGPNRSNPDFDGRVLSPGAGVVLIRGVDWDAR